MDEIGDYLSRLRKGLKGISDSEREEITAEIRSHIEGGLQDPRTGASERQRLERIMSFSYLGVYGRFGGANIPFAENDFPALPEQSPENSLTPIIKPGII